MKLKFNFKLIKPINFELLKGRFPVLIRQQNKIKTENVMTDFDFWLISSRICNFGQILLFEKAK